MAQSTITLNGTAYTVGATNGAAADAAAAGALISQLDIIIENWRQAYVSDGASFAKQGGAAGTNAAAESLGYVRNRLVTTQRSIMPLIRG